LLVPASIPPVLPRCCPQEAKQRGKAEGGGGHRVDLDEEDDLDEFRLPMSHRPTENLNTEGLEQASVHTQLTASNVGFRLLQKMGWKTGKGLGKNEQGIALLLLLHILPSLKCCCAHMPSCHECLRLGCNSKLRIHNEGGCVVLLINDRIGEFSWL
jgi:hypothetical protein